MMPARHIAFFLGCACIGLTGCDLVPQRYRLAAEPLMDVPPAWVGKTDTAGAAPRLFPANVRLSTPMDEANVLVQDSQEKCAAFVDSLFAETAGAGLTLDVLSTGTSAVAAIVTPLSTSHALSAASTVLGAGKSGITANYLNTLSLAHITQAILASYNNDMTDYINSLAAVRDANSINIFTERSKIEHIHKKCSLANAETTISNTLQNPGSATPGQGLQKVHTVVAAETDPTKLASALANDINGTFGTAGAKATASGNVVMLTRPAALTLTVTSSPASLVTYVPGPPDLLAVVGRPQTGNTITISGPPATQQSGTGGSPSPAPPSPPPASVAPALIAPAPPALLAPAPGPAAITAPATPAGAPLNK